MDESEKPAEPVKEAAQDETPLVAVEFTSAALALLVRVLNEAGPDNGATVEIKDLARGSVRVVVTPEAEEEAPAVEVPPKVAEKLSDATVAEAGEIVTKAKQVEQLDVLEAAEKGGKNRVGVLAAIAKRRAELEAK